MNMQAPDSGEQAAADDCLQSSAMTSITTGPHPSTRSSSVPSELYGEPPPQSWPTSSVFRFNSKVSNALGTKPTTARGAAPGSTVDGRGTLVVAFLHVTAVAGLVFKNGTKVATDLILLALGAKSLHFSVTQPW